MSQRRPARKREPVEREALITAVEPEPVREPPDEPTVATDAYDPGGLLVLVMFALVIVAIVFVVVMTWMAS